MNKLYQSYYTHSEPIVEYMIKMLCPEEGLKYLEPAVGDGVFISALEPYLENSNVDAFDLNPDSLNMLKNKYKNKKTIRLKNIDTLLDVNLDMYSNFGGIYDRIIANPPYGAWQDYEKRKLLKKIFKGFYVKESYTLFLYRCVELLKDRGKLVFIIPDTFLNLHRHSKLREYLLQNTKINEIAIFPSSFFPGISFGYSKLCIISLEKCSKKSECLSHKITVRTAFKSVNNLIKPDGERKYYFSQNEVLLNIDSALFISENHEVTRIINNGKTRIGDIAHCVTGIYSGNDKVFMHVVNHGIKNSKNYTIVDQLKIYNEKAPPLNGINNKKCFIPVMKGGTIRYVKPSLWFLDWSQDAVTNYKANEKARFQNSKYYFKEGIGVPMVSSSNITGALIERRLFDQSIVGVFPKNQSYLLYLLAFFNTNICNKIIRTINPSANNPANYIKKIPFIYPNKKILDEVSTITTNIIHELKRNSEENIDELISQLNQIFDSLYFEKANKALLVPS